MKSTLTLIIALLIVVSTFAQQGINYKALIKDDLGNVVANVTNIDVQFTIYEGVALTNPVYLETHTNVSTDANGIVVLNIGSGTTTDLFTDIVWGNDEHWLNVQVDIGAGLMNVSTTQFMAVPYALHALSSSDNSWVKNGDNIYNSNLENIGINISNPKTKFHMSPEAFLIGNDTIGSGDKLMWLPKLHAFRVGTLSDIGTDGLPNPYWNNETYYDYFHEEEMNYIGEYSFASGRNTRAQGFGATAMGRDTEATNSYAMATGYFTNADGQFSTAMGFNTDATGRATTALGYSTDANAAYSTAIGRLNIGGGSVDEWIESDSLFEIGNGSSDSNRNNALTVLKNGKTGIGIATPSSVLEIAHKNGSPEAESLSVLNTDTNNSWQFHTTNYLNLYRNGVFKGSWNATSGAYVQASDRRVKKDIIPLNNGTLNKVMQLNPVSYLMKDQTDSKRNLGLISQEVQALFPSITHYVKESDLLALSYTELIPILIKALQEQQVIIDTQNTKNTDQDKSIEALLARLDRLESKSSN
ncbi:tail fiber domain-containing protein [Winogradskyella sp. PE311]|uniref:tail fiber domain-containing protein n=1 Tax=Winogradskyella sp. PE311 TaxID=3366943 RepID=UPI00397FA548